jgi:hypothetical protein
MKKKKIIIFSTAESLISIPLVHHVISHKKYINYEFDIFLTKRNFIRSIKVLLVIIFYGSFFDLIKSFKTIKKIEDLKKFKNVKILKKIIKNDYDFGLNIYGIIKLKLQKYKIYNFHLGSLFNQRGSFIFYYRYFYNWDSVSLTFHQMEKRFDAGRILNERKIKNIKNKNAFYIIKLYLNNLDFLISSINKIDKKIKYKKYKKFEKLFLVPGFPELIKSILKRFFLNKN